MEYSLIGPSYVDQTLTVAAQDTINWIPEKVEADGGRAEYILRTPPGLMPFCELNTSGCRGINKMANVFYAVYGSKLYQINANSSFAFLGSIAGIGPVSMANNGTQLVIVNGAQGYAYNNQTHLFGQITDPDFQPANTVAYIDGYFVFDGNGGQFFISQLGDGTQYDALDFATAESAPDDTISVFEDHQEVWVCGELTIEIWTDTGNPDFPFERAAGEIIERGVAGPYTMNKIDNTVYWLADNGIVYKAAGHNPTRISTYAIEQEIQKFNMFDFLAWTFVYQGHWFYVLQCPDNGKTFIYDASTQLWHRRKSYEVDYWRGQFEIDVYGTKFVGDSQNGKVWMLTEGVYTEGDDPMVSERYTQYLHAEQNPVFNHGIELVFDVGQGLEDGTTPIVDIRWSDDGGHNYCNFRQRSLGKTGEYTKRVRIHGMGMFRSRLFHIRVSDPVKRDVLVGEVRQAVGTTN